MKKFLLSISLVCLLLTSCISPETRIVSLWELTTVLLNDKVIFETDIYPNTPGTWYSFFDGNMLAVTIFIKKDGNIERRESYTGSWRLENKNKEVVINFTLIDRTYNYTASVKKLTNKQFIYEYYDKDKNHWRFEMISKSVY